MKKGYYIHFQGRISIGVSKKIDMQMEEFRKFYDMQEMEVPVIARGLGRRLIDLWPTRSIARDYEWVLGKLREPAFLYIRRTVADKAYIEFLQEIKSRFPECKIIIEIFTYPYDKDDFGKWNAWPFFIKECIYRKELKKYVDRFVTYSDDRMIFGVPTIRTSNGINVEKIREIRGVYKEGQLVLVGVAYMQRQHGYERVINGMKDYYKKEPKYDVFLYLAGDGPEKKKYMDMVRQYGLDKYVKFYPVITGEELDELYDQADIALAALAMYKSGVYGKYSALKTRECMVKGIPMLSGSEIDVLDKDSDYVKVFENNGSNINIDEVICYFEHLKEKYGDKMTLANQIRSFAKEHVSIEKAMEPIIGFIEQ